jgi:hypothetical protein
MLEMIKVASMANEKSLGVVRFKLGRVALLAFFGEVRSCHARLFPRTVDRHWWRNMLVASAEC